MKLYNTLTRKKENFVPISNEEVTMYSCGPTVYNFAHIGNMRTYIFMDLLRRCLQFEGYTLKGVMNITDVGHLQSDADDGEDKMEKAAKAQNKSPYEIAAYYTKVFNEDLEKLNIQSPEIVAKATDHIDDMINYVVELQKAGYAYETSDGIYFDISKFPKYGQLSRIKLDEQMAGARVEENTEKRNHQDFALWKKAEPTHIMQWESPWGMGFPGWHIECSAMSTKYLGRVFDIHTGGVDHIPIHHENEIAQNEALTKKKSVNYWMHGEFMLVNNGKMSKSLGNTYTITQLEDMGYSPMVFRYFCLNAHYRKKLNFTFEGMEACKKAYNRLLAALYLHKMSDNVAPAEKLEKYKKDYAEAINDDLNVPLALGILFTMTKEEPSKDYFALALEFDKVFGLSLENSQPINEDETKDEIPSEVSDLVNARAEAKANKDWAKADEIRAKITELGYSIKDTKDGAVVSKL
ncbi:MAG: cysteine--tRNA ligase [Clostridia bacterium]|nr:cysteine--tRNA ligase [Clostridia bacterium]